MHNRERRSQIQGIDLGQMWDSRMTVVDQLAAKDITIKPEVVTALRSGATRGRLLTEQLLSAERIESNNAQMKDDYYTHIIEKAIDLRTVIPRFPKRYQVLDYTKDVSAELEMPYTTLVKTIRAMRADLVSVDSIEPDERLRDQFAGTVDQYMRAYATPPSLQSKLYQTLAAVGNERSIASFYELMFTHVDTRGIATWAPYEMDVLGAFYESRREQRHPLTLFDRAVLTGIHNNWDEGSLSERIAETLPVPMDKGILRVHRNALLYGSDIQNKELYQTS